MPTDLFQGAPPLGPNNGTEESDKDDEDYTVAALSAVGESHGPEEADTLVHGAVQHVRHTGYPSDKGVKKSIDINEKPNKRKNQKFAGPNPKPTKAQLLAEPISHSLFFKAADSFEQPEEDKARKYQPNALHKLKVNVYTPSGRLLEYEETVGRIVVLDYNKSILSKAFNPSKFDFNP